MISTFSSPNKLYLMQFSGQPSKVPVCSVIANTRMDFDKKLLSLSKEKCFELRLNIIYVIQIVTDLEIIHP